MSLIRRIEITTTIGLAIALAGLACWYFWRDDLQVMLTSGAGIVGVAVRDEWFGLRRQAGPAISSEMIKLWNDCCEGQRAALQSEIGCPAPRVKMPTDYSIFAYPSKKESPVMNISSTIDDILAEAPDFVTIAKDLAPLAQAIESKDIGGAISAVRNLLMKEADFVKVFNDIKALGAGIPAPVQPQPEASNTGVNAFLEGARTADVSPSSGIGPYVTPQQPNTAGPVNPAVGMAAMAGLPQQ